MASFNRPLVALTAAALFVGGSFAFAQEAPDLVKGKKVLDAATLLRQRTVNGISMPPE